VGLALLARGGVGLGGWGHHVHRCMMVYIHLSWRRGWCNHFMRRTSTAVYIKSEEEHSYI
jgi:hypothetical protein